ncbi:hypothetical protein PCANC_10480 [Puccinia coronata f. sp. avenae]|uniref:Uncharacterized protein n=1 Tax=Puccinia coronata f. sp. avenae TaxID=200324 RepID=A0A2N5UX29_9BASI|nr:hypothetical protein PCANC_10480 [Puccinia coronata f. sp. avenae]
MPNLSTKNTTPAHISAGHVVFVCPTGSGGPTATRAMAIVQAHNYRAAAAERMARIKEASTERIS